MDDQPKDLTGHYTPQGLVYGNDGFPVEQPCPTCGAPFVGDDELVLYKERQALGVFLEGCRSDRDQSDLIVLPDGTTTRFAAVLLEHARRAL